MIFTLIDKEKLQEDVGTYVALMHGWKYATWEKSNFLYDLDKKWQFSFAAFDDGKLVGFCFASNKIVDVYYIHLLFISSHTRGKSIGEGMLSHAKKIALQHNLHCIELRCPESNERAFNFYKKNGFNVKSKVQDEISGSEADYYLKLDF